MTRLARPTRHVRVHGESHGLASDRLNRPGYVGYEEGGQLTEAVRRKPFSVVLFDEIEKRTRRVQHLLQILEDGQPDRRAGPQGRLKNTVIIMTSNLGTRDIQKGPGVGFAARPDEQVTYDKMKDKVTEELKKSFRPEFLKPDRRGQRVPLAYPRGREADRRPPDVSGSASS